VGKAAIEEELLAPFARIWEDRQQRVTFNNVVAAGDQVVVELTGGGTTADDNQYENHYCYVVRVRDGRIDRIRGYTDTGYALGMLWGPQRQRPSFD
jgi:ketosteroid isomerase-like protein